jgi:hypothetical protein
MEKVASISRHFNGLFAQVTHPIIFEAISFRFCGTVSKTEDITRPYLSQ